MSDSLSGGLSGGLTGGPSVGATAGSGLLADVCELHCRIEGPADAPPLLLGGSLGTSLAMWQPQLAALTERYRVIRYDHRGHGESPVPPAPYRIDDLGCDVIALLDRLGLDRAHVGGLSLGGMVGMWLAANAPERVDRLMLLCAVPSLGPPQTWAKRAETVRTAGMQAVAEAVVGRWFTPRFAGRHRGVVSWAMRQLTATPAQGYANCCEVIEHLALEPALASICAQTLVVAGADDPATPPAMIHDVASAIPNARMAIVPDAAHLANVEQPQAVTELMLDFLEAG